MSVPFLFSILSLFFKLIAYYLMENNMQLTEEQKEIVEAVTSPYIKGIIAVNAVAGSGKTSTAYEVIKAYNPKNGFYTAFNKAIVTDSSKKFGSLIEARTIHSLAYRYVKPKLPIEEFNYLSIKEDVSYETKTKVIELLDDFYRSSELNVYDYVSVNSDDSDVQNLVCNYACRMLEGKTKPTFNYLLKCLHILLVMGKVSIDRDLLILDECQDTTAVTLEIFKLINADKKLILGDKFQNIYSFMKTVNAFELLEEVVNYHLTTSFRCSPYIASNVEDFGSNFLDSQFKYKGVDKDADSSIVYLTRSNAALIDKMYEMVIKGETFSITRDINSIFSMPIAMLNAAKGRTVYDKQYKYLEYEYKKYASKYSSKDFLSYIEETIQSPAITSTVKLLRSFRDKRINIYELRESIMKQKENPNYILSTAHTFKGLEANTAIIADDLNNSITSVLESHPEIKMYQDPEIWRGIVTKEERENLNTYYVALSRAKNKLINNKY